MKIEDALQRFVENKEKCEIHLITREAFFAKIIEIGDGFIRIDDGYTENIVNTAYIVRVRIIDKKSNKKEIKETSKKKGISENIRNFFFAE